MANSQHDPVVAQLERQKLTLIASLSSVAEQMRHCANVADHFAQMLTEASFNGNLSVPLYAGSKRHGAEDGDIGGTSKKRRTTSKKAKDPDAPKRAASSYIFFQNDLRQELRKQHPDSTPAEIMTRVSKQWAEMTPEQKAPYERLQAEAKQRWEAEKRAYDERRGIVAPAKPASRKTVAATVTIEEPVQHTAVGSPGAKSARKTPESSDSSTDTSSSDKSSGEEDGAGENSGGEEDEEMDEEAAVPSPPPTKSKAKRKGETAMAPTAKPKSKANLSAGPTPARLEKKKRSKA